MEKTVTEFSARTDCALCWHSLADEPEPLVRVCDDGSLLRCHRSHGLTARLHRFLEPADAVAPVSDPVSAVQRHGDHCLSRAGWPSCGDPVGHHASALFLH